MPAETTPPKTLSAAQWASFSGTTLEWEYVRERQESRLLRTLGEAIAKRRELCSGAELSVLSDAAARLGGSSRELLRPLFRSPSFDSLVDSGTSPRRARGKEVLTSDVSAAAATAAVLTGESGSVPLWIRPGGRMHLSPLGVVLEFPAGNGFGPGTLTLRAGRLVCARRGGERALVRRLPEARSGLRADASDPLIADIYNSSAALSSASSRFLNVIGAAVDAIPRIDPAAAAEFSDLIRLVVPLASSDPNTSHSSSMGNARGAIYMSEHDDLPLQYETLIHEFCHHKLHLLEEVDALVAPGQASPVFYSPWRPDPRPVRGLLIGAHAFINVMCHLIFLEQEVRLSPQERFNIEKNLFKRARQCRAALDVVARRARMTPFGSQFLLRLYRDLARVEDRLPPSGTKFRTLARRECDAHRRLYSVRGGDIHRHLLRTLSSPA